MRVSGISMPSILLILQQKYDAVMTIRGTTGWAVFERSRRSQEACKLEVTACTIRPPTSHGVFVDISHARRNSSRTAPS